MLAGGFFIGSFLLGVAVAFILFVPMFGWGLFCFCCVVNEVQNVGVCWYMFFIFFT